MTIINPSIFIQRARIVCSQKVVYDQAFHNGLNIIAGENSVGKTSLIQLIMHGLGYAIEDEHWKEEAKACTVYLELKLNGNVITVRRDNRSNYEKNTSIPMEFCFDPIDIALIQNRESWERYPYIKTDNKESFSTHMSRLLNIPPARENDKNINLHNMFRLLYSSQERPLSMLYNPQPFDSKIAREDIANYLLNTYDDDIVVLKRQLEEKEKKLDESIKEIKSFYSIANKFSQSFILDGGNTQQELSKRKEKITSEIEEIQFKINELRKESLSSLNVKGEKEAITRSVEDFSKLKSKSSEIQQKINYLEYDIKDSESFIKELELTKKSIHDAITLSHNLDSVIFTHCPSCFNELKFEDSSPEYCPLCNRKKADKQLNLLQMQHEIEMQLTESNNILIRKKYRLIDFKSVLKNIDKELRNRIITIKTIEGAINQENDEKIYGLYDEINSKKGEINDIEKSLKAYQYIEEKSKERDGLQSDVNTLKARLEAESTFSEKRYKKNEKVIKAFLENLLKNDNSKDEDFKNISSISFSFGDDSLVLNNKSLSASSTSYLYHSFLISLLLSSLQLDYLRIPRIVFIDGLDSYGIDQDRLKNFQNIIKNQLDNYHNVEFQLFFTTGIVADELTSCIVDKFYQKGEHTLQFSVK